MPNCITCGRELPSPNEPHGICPECRALIMQQPESRPPAAAARQRPVALRHAPVTTGIIAVNVLVFVAMAATGHSPWSPDLPGLVKWGANDGLRALLTQPWRMLTSTYVHIGIIHIALNMWCLWNLGILAEQIFDRWTYFLTYTLCGIAGSLVSIAVHPIRIGAGASGAIFGMAGALISALYLGHLPVHPSALKSTLKSLLSFAGYNLIFGAVVPAIDNSAHIGGLVTGLVLGAGLAPHLNSPPRERRSWNIVVLFIAAFVLLCAYSVTRHFATQLLMRQLHHSPAP